jgi:hypothetical protein
MKLPIWIDSWEIECCQPDATVRDSWATYPFVHIGSLPWWANKATKPIPPEVARLGTVELDGTVNDEGNQITLAGCGVSLPIRGEAVAPPFLARLLVDAHVTKNFPVTGIVEEVLGVKYRRKDGWPIEVLSTLHLASTSGQRGRFDQYLVTLRVSKLTK